MWSAKLEVARNFLSLLDLGILSAKMPIFGGKPWNPQLKPTSGSCGRNYYKIAYVLGNAMIPLGVLIRYWHLFPTIWQVWVVMCQMH